MISTSDYKVLRTKTLKHFTSGFLIIISSFLSPSYSQVSISSLIGVSNADASIVFLGADPNRQQFIQKKYGSIILPFGGIQVQANINRYLLFTSELQLISKGQRIKSAADKLINRFIFLDIASSIEVKLGNLFRIGVGPYVGRKLKDLPYDLVLNYDLIYSKDWDYGVNANLTIRHNNISIRFSYMHGIAEVFTAAFYPRFKHRSYQIGVGYTLWQQKSKESKSRR